MAAIWEGGFSVSPKCATSAPPALRGADDLEADLGVAGAGHVDFLGGGERDVDQAAADERPAVVDPDDDAEAVGDVGDPELRSERQGAVGGGEAVGIEALAAGGAVAGELAPVIAGLALADGFEDILLRGRRYPDVFVENGDGVREAAHPVASGERVCLDRTHGHQTGDSEHGGKMNAAAAQARKQHKL